jgi:hypothetical protein
MTRFRTPESLRGKVRDKGDDHRGLTQMSFADVTDGITRGMVGAVVGQRLLDECKRRDADVSKRDMVATACRRRRDGPYSLTKQPPAPFFGRRGETIVAFDNDSFDPAAPAIQVEVDRGTILLVGQHVRP